MRTFRKKALAASGAVGGWTLDNDAIFSGTKSLSEGFSSSGITLGSDGSIHAERFHLNADGTVGIRSGTATGKRVEIDSVNNRIDLFASNNINILTLDDTIEGSLYPGMAVRSPADPTDKAVFDIAGVKGYTNGVKTLELTQSGIFLGTGLPTGGTNLKAVYFSLDDGKFYRAT